MVKKNVLELFSGTHSWGKELHKKFNVVSLDRDIGGECPLKSGYKSDTHIQEDILTWDYKVYKPNHFYLITASPVCSMWSNLRNTWIGRKLKEHGDTIITKEILQQDIDNYGKPMVDKMIEIIEYFKPKYYVIENPHSSKMRHYIDEAYPNYASKCAIASYCKYSDWGYEKKTRFWTNIPYTPLICKKDCDNIITIKTQKGAIHKGKKILIKGTTRTLHKNPIGDTNKAVDDDQKIHKERMGTTKTVMVDGQIIRVNTKALREKYKDHVNLQIGKKELKKNKHNKNMSTDVGGGNNRLERYRIPSDLIKEFINLI
tara:strand:+ start:2175 stop:3119 length:945 start_codon:yes stop_codon:yes gene_type:complete